MKGEIEDRAKLWDTTRSPTKGQRFNRRRFLRLGGAGIVGLAGGLGALAYVQSKKTKRSVLSYGAKGDGSRDDGPAIRAALEDPDVSEIEFPAVSRGYHVDMSVPDWRPFPLRDGHRLLGGGREGAIVRTGAPDGSGRTLFATEDNVRGAENLLVRDLYVDGRRDDLRLENEFDTVFIAVSIRSRWTEEAEGQRTFTSGNFEMSNCYFRGWPGAVLNAAGLEDFKVHHNRVECPLRGGLIFNFYNRSGNVSHNEVYDAGDDTIGFNADGNRGNVNHPQRGPSNDVLVAHNVLSRVTEKPPSFTQPLAGGPVIAVRSGTNIRLRANRVIKGRDQAITLERRPDVDPVPATRITVLDNELRGCPEGALTVMAEGVRGRAEGNVVVDCGKNVYRNASADTFVVVP